MANEFITPNTMRIRRPNVERSVLIPPGYIVGHPVGGELGPALIGSFPEIAQLIVKEVDESRSSQTALMDDAELVATVAANSIYQFEVLAFVRNDSSTPDIRASMKAPNGSTIRFHARYWDNVSDILTNVDGAVSNESDETQDIDIQNDPDTVVELKGCVQTGVNTGNLAFRWAQRVSDADATTVKKCSYMKLQLYRRLEVSS